MMLDVMIIKGLTMLKASKTKKKIKSKKVNVDARWSVNFYFFARSAVFNHEYHFVEGTSSYGHTTMKAPHPIRTAKLSIVGPDQYCSWGQCGNLGCCRATQLFFHFLGKQNFAQVKKGKRHTAPEIPL